MQSNIALAIEDDYDAMSRKAAVIFSKKIKEHPKGAFGFATGSTPIGLYRELVRMHKEDGLDFSGITTFNLDEYYPISRESDQSYYYFMRQNLFDHVNVDDTRTLFLDGQTEDPAGETKKYEAKIESCGGIVMQILGIGVNGHIGFNEPSDSFEANARHVALTEVTIESNSRNFASIDDVPRSALTVGIRCIMLAKHIILVVNGNAKAAILRDSLNGPITPLVPASILQLHPSVVVAADREAAALL